MMQWYQTEVNQWKSKGKMYVWTYLENTKNYPGWHLTADHTGCLSLLDLFENMEHTHCSSERTIWITSPSFAILKIPNNKEGYARWRAPQRLKVKYLYEIMFEQYWHLEEESPSKALLIVGTKNLHNLQQGIKDIMNGRGDYSIGLPKTASNSIEMSLWFW